MDNKPIRIVEGSAQPHAKFWNWIPRNETGSEAEIKFYGYISEYSWWGDEITPAKFAEELSTYGRGEPIQVRIHSGGGDMLAASAIRAMLSDYPGRVTVRIDGLCASAAVAVALAGDRIIIQDSAYMMIHNPGYTMLYGWMDAEYLRATAADLDKFAESILGIYASRTGYARDDIAEMMAAETWMTAQDAVEMGFADEIANGGRPADNASIKNLIQCSVNPPDELSRPAAVVSERAVELRERVRNLLGGRDE